MIGICNCVVDVDAIVSPFGRRTCNGICDVVVWLFGTSVAFRKWPVQPVSATV
jgi:hypothetical protein